MQDLASLSKLRQNRLLAAVAFLTCGGIAFVLLGKSGLLVSVLFLPLMVFLTLQTLPTPSEETDLSAPQKRPFLLGWLSRFLGQIDHPTVAMVVEIDNFNRLEEVYGNDTMEAVITFVQNAIETHLTELDVTVHLDGPRFGAALAPQAPHDIEGMLNTCTRIQHAMANAPLATPLPVQLTASIGFASSDRIKRPTAENLTDSAFAALAEARRKAPSAVRRFSRAIAAKRASELRTAKDATRALDQGEIFAYFQPQINLMDGSLAGFEALTRWHHPTRGILSPAEFLPALEQAALLPNLGDKMIRQAIQALNFWDTSGIHVPMIGVNFSTEELRNPRLVDRVSMHLEVGNIAPERLVIEVLETVVAHQAEEDIVANLAALADLGCGIDLDDFGTGYASITNIKRFSVGRIKIDRSFVSGIDSDLVQRNMVGAILNMAERLGVSTLAEGIETRAECDVLRSLGCENAQGFQIARPMPIEETVDWARAYFGRDAAPLEIARRAS